MDEDHQAILAWVADYFDSPQASRILINALLATQAHFGYLPKAGIRAVAEELDLTPAKAYGVATFYNHFRFVPPGKQAVRVCMGTACHIKQASKILDHWERELGIGPGQVTEDREYSLDRVACVGCCTLAPVALVNERVIGDMSPTKVDGLLLQHRLAMKESAKGETE
jgi:NADH-quinone oxidoreductase subunit E